MLFSDLRSLVALSALAGFYSLQALSKFDPLSVVNLGLLAGGSYTFYTHPNLRRDTKIIASAAAATFALFSIESYTIEVCQNPPKKTATNQKNNEEGPTAAFVHRYIREHVPRSGVVGGTAGVGRSIQCTC